MHVTPSHPSIRICAESWLSGSASLPLRLIKFPVMHDLRARNAALAQSDSARSSTIKKVARDLVAVAARHEHVLLAIPLDAIGGERDRGVLFARRKARPLVAREPVVEEKSIPAAQAQSIAMVVSKLAMAHAEAPHAIQMRAVASEARNLAALDAKPVFVFPKLCTIRKDSVDSLAQPTAVQRQPFDRCAARVGKIQKASHFAACQPQYSSAGAAVVPRWNADQRRAGPHM